MGVGGGLAEDCFGRSDGGVGAALAGSGRAPTRPPVVDGGGAPGLGIEGGQGSAFFWPRWVELWEGILPVNSC
jgi:hypothetical protein